MENFECRTGSCYRQDRVKKPTVPIERSVNIDVEIIWGELFSFAFKPLSRRKNSRQKKVQ